MIRCGIREEFLDKRIMDFIMKEDFLPVYNYALILTLPTRSKYCTRQQDPYYLLFYHCHWTCPYITKIRFEHRVSVLAVSGLNMNFKHFKHGDSKEYFLTELERFKQHKDSVIISEHESINRDEYHRHLLIYGNGKYH